MISKQPSMRWSRDLFYHSPSLLLVLVQQTSIKWTCLMLMMHLCSARSWIDTLPEILCSSCLSVRSRMTLTALPKRSWPKFQTSSSAILHLETSNPTQRSPRLALEWTSTTWWKTKCSKWWNCRRTSSWPEKFSWSTTWSKEAGTNNKSRPSSTTWESQTKTQTLLITKWECQDSKTEWNYNQLNSNSNSNSTDNLIELK